MGAGEQRGLAELRRPGGYTPVRRAVVIPRSICECATVQRNAQSAV